MELAVASHKDWFFITYLVIIAVVAFLFQQYPKLFVYYWRTTFTLKVHTFQRDDSQAGRLVGLGLDLTAIIVFTLFFWVFNVRYEWIDRFGDLQILLFIGSFWFLFLFGKLLMVWLMGWLFGESRMSQIHVTQLQVNNRLNGLMLLPLILTAYYVNIKYSAVFIGFGLVLLMLQFLIRMVKIFFTSIQQISLPSYFSILYLCTVEILPIALVAKLLL